MKLEESNIKLAVPVSERDHIRGPIDAPVTLVEYGDYECPWCAKAHPVLAELRERAGNLVRIVFRHFPLNTIHAHASVAAQAAEAAGAQGKFWEMHDELYAHQDELSEGDFSRYARRIGLEPYRFESDLSSARFAYRVKEDYESGVRSGVTGTPTIYINDDRYHGPIEVDAMLTIGAAGK